MISNHDRSGYIGASDTKFVIGNWNTKTFTTWWLQKQGIDTSNYQNKYTLAGTNYEHKIIDFLDIENVEKDKQIINGRLRVNLDANNSNKIYEIKTYQNVKGFDINKHKDYQQQVQVQMFASGIHKAEIVAYGLEPSDYDNYLHDIDSKRISKYEIEYDEKWIYNVYLPRFKYLEKCLIDGRYPNEKEIEYENI